MRRTKAGVLSELPPILWRDIRLELSARQRTAYDEVWESRHDSLAHEKGNHTSDNMLALVTILKQLCNLDHATGESSKLEALRSLLEKVAAQGDKVLIFSRYVQTLHWLSARISLPSRVFHGRLSSETREEIIGEFKGTSGTFALLISLHAGSVGLNLNEASTVIMFDRWWNPAVESQAIQRAHRFGREVPLKVIRFVVEGTIEERILEILEEKMPCLPTISKMSLPAVARVSAKATW